MQGHSPHPTVLITISWRVSTTSTTTIARRSPTLTINPLFEFSFPGMCNNCESRTTGNHSEAAAGSPSTDSVATRDGRAGDLIQLPAIRAATGGRVQN